MPDYRETPGERQADWMVTRCTAGGCLHLHIERSVITMTPEELVRLARLINGAVEHYGLSDEAPPNRAVGAGVAH